MTTRVPTIEEVRAGYELGDDRILPGEDKAWMAQARRSAEFDRWLAAHDAAVRAEVVAHLDLELQRETVHADPYATWTGEMSKQQKHYGRGFKAGLVDAFTRFRRISERHADPSRVNAAAQLILDGKTAAIEKEGTA